MLISTNSFAEVILQRLYSITSEDLTSKNGIKVIQQQGIKMACKPIKFEWFYKERSLNIWCGERVRSVSTESTYYGGEYNYKNHTVIGSVKFRSKKTVISYHFRNQDVEITINEY